MYIESVPNRNSPPAILLRQSFRDGAKIKKTHHCQSVGLAGRTRRGAVHAAKGRHRDAGRPGEHHRAARLAARS
jgi:hypothetical protein